MNVTGCLYFPIRSFEVTRLIVASSVSAISLNGLMIIAASIGNALVIMVIFKTRELRTNGNILIFFLAVTDFSVGIVVQPLFMAFELTTILKKTPICSVVVAYTVTRALCSILSLVTVLLVGLERSLAIFKPLKYTSLVSKRRLVFLVLGIWLFWTLLVMSRFIGITTKIFRITVSSVIITCHLLTGFTYVRIERLASKHVKKIRAQMVSVANSANGHASRYKREKRALRTTTLIVGCILLCYAPIVVVLLANILAPLEAHISHVMFTWADIFAYLNSSLNPMIYCLRNAEFRRGILSILRLRKEERHNQVALETTGRITRVTTMENVATAITSESPAVLLQIRYLENTTENEK